MRRKLLTFLALLLLGGLLLWLPYMPASRTCWLVDYCLELLQSPSASTDPMTLILDSSGLPRNLENFKRVAVLERLRAAIRDMSELKTPPRIILLIHQPADPNDEEDGEFTLGEVIRGVQRIRQAAADVGVKVHIEIQTLPDRWCRHPKNLAPPEDWERNPLRPSIQPSPP